jgi:multiple sugar transport system substrate-binding protein
MSKKIIVKTNGRNSEAIEYLNTLLTAYGTSRRIEIECASAALGSEYSELVLTALHGYPLDIAELGTTFVRDFVAMNGLRAFQTTEVPKIGSSEDFFSFLWQAGNQNGQIWAIPWLSDLRMIFYRRDWLEKAGIKEHNAFSTPAQLEQTLQALKESGVATPWAFSSTRGAHSIQAIASWVWFQGGQFIDAANKKVLLDSPAVLTGIQDFYRLHRYFASDWKDNDLVNSESTFMNGQAAVTISGPWAFSYLHHHPSTLENTGIASVLGHSFVGGSVLSISKHSYQEQAAVNIIQYLTGHEFQSQYPHRIGMLPGRINALDNYPFPKEDYRHIIKQALQNGRELPGFSLWGLVESRLVTTLAKLWDDIRANPEADTDELVTKQMVTTNKRIDALLARH